MEEKKVSIIDQILDENNYENIKLYNEKDEMMEFEQIAVVPIDDKGYVILKPVKAVKGLKQDEAVLFEINLEKRSIVLVAEQKIIDKVFAEYKKMYDAQE